MSQASIRYVPIALTMRGCGMVLDGLMLDDLMLDGLMLGDLMDNLFSPVAL